MNRFGTAVVCAAATFGLISCGSDAGRDPPLPGRGGNPGTGGTSSSGNGNGSGGLLTPSGGRTGNGGTAIAFGGTSSTAGTDGNGTAGACASQNAVAKVLPVNLAFAFDVSGSMGKGDKPWHDRMLKWDPVVAATKAFFQDPASDGLTASLTFFPDQSDKCEDASYVTPDVPLTALPSPLFGTALDGIGSQDWRGGTPTLHVMRGTVSFVQQQMQTTPGRYVIVLVTDGYPQDCDDDAIASVVNVVSGIAATIPTYVVGVKNPPIDDAPDTVTDLTAVAMAGGTDHAYIIDTGNPTKTAADFKATIDTIRGAAISCNVEIPAAPDGRQFDKQKVVVNYTSGAANNALTYDANCAQNNAWHYDNAANPTQILLCPNTCMAIQQDPAGALNVEFACETKITVPL
jgi:hypothetical protein